jgi:uncharacterized membrane-anchored protein
VAVLDPFEEIVHSLERGEAEVVEDQRVGLRSRARTRRRSAAPRASRSFASPSAQILEPTLVPGASSVLDFLRRRLLARERTEEAEEPLEPGRGLVEQPFLR